MAISTVKEDDAYLGINCFLLHDIKKLLSISGGFQCYFAHRETKCCCYALSLESFECWKEQWSNWLVSILQDNVNRYFGLNKVTNVYFKIIIIIVREIVKFRGAFASITHIG